MSLFAFLKSSTTNPTPRAGVAIIERFSSGGKPGAFGFLWSLLSIVFAFAFMYALLSAVFSRPAHACGWLTECNRYEEADKKLLNDAREWIEYQDRIKQRERIRERDARVSERDRDVREELRAYCTADPTRCATADDIGKVQREITLRHMESRQ